MRRKPRRPDEPLFNRAMLMRSVLLGLLVLLFTAATYVLALRWFSETESRALVFMCLVISNLALISVSRSGTASPQRFTGGPTPFSGASSPQLSAHCSP
jgi:Ca2+-transporting ATPase